MSEDDTMDSMEEAIVPEVIPPRSVALRKVVKDPVNHWKHLPWIYRTDKAFCIAVLQQAATLPPKSDFERPFPQSLRFDRDVVLAFAARSDFVRLYHERHLFVPGCLTSDKEVMMAYCSKIPRSLQECSEELTDDVDVVLAAIGLDGLELQYASRRLQEDEAMLRAACARDGRALDFCPPGMVRDRLVQDREFLMTVLAHHGSSMLRHVKDPLLRTDRELLLTAVQHGMLLRNCPTACRNDVSFVVAAVTRKAGVYLELSNSSWCNNATVAKAAVTAPDSTPNVIELAVNAVPLLLRDDAVAVAITDRASAQFMKEYILDRPHLLENKDIMLRAIARECDLYSSCDDRLKEDVDIVMAAITEDSAVTVLRALPATWLSRHVNVVVKAVTVCHRNNLRVLKPVIADELWRTSRDLQMAWIRRGCRVLEQFEATVRTDREMALTVAEFSWAEFHKVGDELRGDWEFMKQAVALSGNVLRYAQTDIRDNVVMAVRAVASNAHALAPPIRITRSVLQQHVEQHLALHDIFVLDFLRGIAVGGPGSALPMLDRGIETGTAFKQLIASFLGVPVGDLLAVYRQCLDHLTNPPPFTTITGVTEAAAERHVLRRRLRHGIGIGAAEFVFGDDDSDGDDDDEDMMPFFRAARRAGGRDEMNAGRPLAAWRLAAAADRQAARDPAAAAGNAGQPPAAAGNAQPPEERAGLLRRAAAMFQLRHPVDDRRGGVRDEDHVALHARRRALVRLRFHRQDDNNDEAAVIEAFDMLDEEARDMMDFLG